MCGDKFIDDLCSLVGNMASNWGYFESEIIFILTKRLEIYFNAFETSHNLGMCWVLVSSSEENSFNRTRAIILFKNMISLSISHFTDYQWLMRVVRLLSALGDFAFRELTVYFHKINPIQVPESLQCHLNVSDLIFHNWRAWPLLPSQIDFSFQQYFCVVEPTYFFMNI